MSPASQTVWAVVPAAGRGTRMARERPKQYLTIDNTPLIEISLKKLLAVDELAGIIVALGADDKYWRGLSIASSAKIHTVQGGSTRSQSVTNALDYLASLEDSGNIWACVHDAARPCVMPARISKLIQYCLSQRVGAILAAPLTDTIKRVAGDAGENLSSEPQPGENPTNKNLTTGNRATGNKVRQSLTISKTENRQYLWQAHTPQMFLLKELKAALDYCEANGLSVTDEASAIENVGGVAHLVVDRRDNIKVTQPEDLGLAEFILREQAKLE